MLDDQQVIFDVNVPLNTNYWYSDFILKEKIIIPLQILINDQTQKHLSLKITEKSFEIYDLSLSAIADMIHFIDNINVNQNYMINQIKKKMNILLNELEVSFSRK